MKKDVLLKFPSDERGFYKELKTNVNNLITTDLYKRAVVVLWVKLFFYFLLFAGSNACLYLIDYSGNGAWLTVNYISIGLMGILLAFNASHDAAHNAFSTSERINNFIYTLTFNLQGVSGY